MKFDFHMHSTASDGLLSPSDLMDLCKQEGLVAAAISDHDTFGGVEEGSRRAAEIGLDYFLGIEFNTDTGGTEIDVLGYFKSIKGKPIVDLAAARKDQRVQRARAMVEKLNDLGIHIEFSRVRELAGGIIARPHVAQAVIEAGYATAQQEVYDKYIGFGKPAYAERDYFFPEDAIRAIHESGGVAIIAHPGLIKDDALVERLLDAGPDGLEAYYAYHTPEQISTYLRMAAERDMLVGCGSDFHGKSRLKTELPGSVIAPEEVYFRLKAAIEAREKP